MREKAPRANTELSQGTDLLAVGILAGAIFGSLRAAGHRPMLAEKILACSGVITGWDSTESEPERSSYRSRRPGLVRRHRLQTGGVDRAAGNIVRESEGLIAIHHPRRGDKAVETTNSPGLCPATAKSLVYAHASQPVVFRWTTVSMLEFRGVGNCVAQFTCSLKGYILVVIGDDTTARLSADGMPEFSIHPVKPPEETPQQTE